jgi:hypothetical protein
MASNNMQAASIPIKSLKVARFFATGSLIDTRKYTRRPARRASSGHPIERASFIRSPTVVTS